MSFQSFAKLPPPPRNRPKILPSPEIMNILTLLCEHSANSYNVRAQVLAIPDPTAFASSLKQKLQRTPQSFYKQLRFLGFKRQREWRQEGEQGIRFVWRGRKEQSITRQLQYTEKHLQSMLVKACELRFQLGQRKSKLDKRFEKGIFWGMSTANQEQIDQKMQEAVQQAKDTINIAHRLSGQFAVDIQTNLECQVSILRLLSFRQNEEQ